MRQHRSRLNRSTAAVALTVLLVGSALGRAAVLPPAELDKLADGTDYKAATAACNAVLGLNRKGAAAAPYNFVHVWTLLAEVELDQGHFEKAAKAAKQGAAEAQASGQVQDGAEAMAMSCLIARSRNGVYTVRGVNNHGKQYNVVHPAVCKAAYPDLFADELDALQNDRWQAQCTTTIDPALAAADKFDAVRAVERVATGNTAQTDQFGGKAATDARQIIDSYITDRNADLTDIASDAKVVVVQAAPAHKVGRRQFGAVRQQLRGLTVAQRKLVTGVRDETAKIDAAVAKMNGGFGTPDAFTNLHKPVAELNRWAERLLAKYPG